MPQNMLQNTLQNMPPNMAQNRPANLKQEMVALRPFLLRMAHRYLRNDDWAEDAVSETLVAALEKPQAFAGRASLRAWLVGILKNKTIDQVRLHTRECPLYASDVDTDTESWCDATVAGANDAPAPWGDPLETLARRQFMAQFQRCIKTLPAQQGRAFMLRNWKEEDTEEICRQLGVSANHLGVLLFRARRSLRAAMQTLWQAVPHEATHPARA
jgi:RNA polymerase sigma-70 factor, ECF subfamily